MNQDDSEYIVGREFHVEARNICSNNIAEKTDGVATPELGNVGRVGSYYELNFTNSHKNIGAYYDRYRNVIYEFTFNSENRHTIGRFDLATNTHTLLVKNLGSTGGVDVLKWNQFTSITSVAVVHREDSEGDLLYWVGSDFLGNQTPCKINVKRFLDGDYGTIEADFISAAKKMPLVVPTVTYIDDATRTVNALRSKLFQFKYRWVYDDFEKSTWSPISEIPLPNNVTGTDADLDATKNNRINITVTTGNKDVIGIEVAARNNVDNNWLDFYQLAYIIKAEEGILDNTILEVAFFNDAVYPAIDLLESTLLFDWLPRKANTLSLVNGDTIVYGGITEGYNRLRRQDMNVAMTVANVTNSGIYAGGAFITYTERLRDSSFVYYTITVTGTLAVGTRFRVYAILYGSGGITLSDYTVLSGNNLQDVLIGLHTSSGVYQDGYTATDYFVKLPLPFSQIVTTGIDYNSNATGINTPSTWNWNSKYKFGLVYFDEYGRTNGVMNYVDNNNVNADFEVNTGNFELDVATPKTPVISANIYHTPPTWAVKYMWVRTPNLAISNFIQYVTADVVSDTDYVYFCLGNIKYYADKNTKFNYPTVSVASGDRIRVMCNANSTGYLTPIHNVDFEVIGIEERQVSGGGPTEVFDYVKVKKPVSYTAYPANVLVSLYTPAKNTSESTNEVYYEFGETYDIYESSGNRYHRGGVQDQDATLPATFEFQNGDVYYRPREIYYDIAGIAAISKAYYVMDANYSDFYKSALNGNGRAQVIDINAKEQYYPVNVRFSQSYVQDTNINGLNRFYFDNMDSYNRSYGDIRRLIERDKELRVYQTFKVGRVPVFQQIIKDSAGGDVLAQSDRLLNKIQYYVGEFGVGDCPESVVSNNFADYFVDNRRGVICRLSLDGITPISVTAKMNSWAQSMLRLRKGFNEGRIYGCFDPQRNRYIICLEASGLSAAETLSFDENRNSFESFHDYFPVRIVGTDSYIVSYLGGITWVHNGPYANYYGTQYKPSITYVYNDGVDYKKTFTNVSKVSNVKWGCTVTTSLNQSSSLAVGDFRQIEDGYHAGFLRDSASPKGLLGGDTLKGNWVKIKYESNNSSNFVYLTSTSVYFIEAPLNRK